MKWMDCCGELFAIIGPAQRDSFEITANQACAVAVVRRAAPHIPTTT